jgi:hypothetical protein
MSKTSRLFHAIAILTLLSLHPDLAAAGATVEIGFAPDRQVLATETAPDSNPSDSSGTDAVEFGRLDPALSSSTQEAMERGWPVHLNNPIGSPVFFDLDGDGISEVIAGDQGHVYVYDAAGNLRPGWPRTTANIDNSPAVGDIDGDGAPEIVVGARGAPPKLWAFRADGVVESGWPVSLPYQTWMNCSNPVLADLNADGVLDVGIAVERGVAFYDGHGVPLPGWPYLWTTSQNLQWSGPAVADIDMDDRPEVVVGNNCLWSESVHVISHDGKAMPGWPKRTAPVFSSPALADLDGDGDLEIVIQDGEWTWIGHSLYAWHHDGTNLAGFPMTICEDYESSRSNPAIADIDDDGTLEIVTATSDGRLHAIHPDGTYLPGFPQTIPGDMISSAQVVDVNGDGIEEIFLTYYLGGNQYVSGWRLNGSVLPGFPKLLLTATQLAAHGSTHIADIDGDGRLELAACGTDLDDGSLCVFEIDGSVYDPHTTRMDWPKIRRDLHNTGFFPWIDPAGVDEGQAGDCPILTIAPNPLEPNSRIVMRDMSYPIGTLRVIDAGGRLLGERAVVSPAEVSIRSIVGDRLSRGVYWLRWLPAVGGPQRSARLIVLGG